MRDGLNDPIGGDSPKARDSAESGLRLCVARGDAVIGSVGPVLRHLLTHGDQALFGDDIMARLRAMLGDLARQVAPDGLGVADLTPRLVDIPGLLAHLHGLALEWSTAVRLQDRIGLDPVLSPLMQALVASSDAETSALAMQALAAQARFAQGARRMQLALRELPAELFHDVSALAAEPQDLRAGYDEAGSRLALLARLVSGLGAGSVAALALDHAGVALFAGALAQAGGLARDHAVLAMQEGQQARLALALRAGGLGVPAIAQVVHLLHPLGAMPEGLARIHAERAGEILAEMALPAGGGW